MKTLPGKGNISRLTLIELLIVLMILVGVHQVGAQGSQFFRISGSAATKIMSFRPDGSLVWSNALAHMNYTVQTLTALPGGTNWVDYVQIPVTNAVNTNLIITFHPPAGMVLVPAGVFTMGDTLDGESDAIPVTNILVSAFYMDVNLVSYIQWQSVYNWATNNGYVFDNAGSGKATNHPVQKVSWYDTVKWCNARSQQAGLAPAYYTDAATTHVYTQGQTPNPYVNWIANGYRLPTEAEWEKAARGGLSGKRFPWGDTISESQANYNGNTGTSYDFGPNGYNAIGSIGGTSPATSPVGSFAANGYGLFDMDGNVFEWCWDWYGTPYGQPTSINPTGPASGTPGYGYGHVMHGGNWTAPAIYSRCAFRGLTGGPDQFSNGIGFRCVRKL